MFLTILFTLFFFWIILDKFKKNRMIEIDLNENY